MSVSRVPAALRDQVRLRANSRCEYCLVREDDVFEPHEADHIVARQHTGSTIMVVFTCEGAGREKSGVMWLRGGARWQPQDISGPKGTKYDLVELLDLDADGDLDVLTCEETDGLGVIWYENPN